ncbi:MAG: MCP four helix bundle domain-containing protein [Cyclobacteriaceae bacterium]|nr:MCP four helix bundle domain-containing protein [Cyclobacteriaceae bacterium]
MKRIDALQGTYKLPLLLTIILASVLVKNIIEDNHVAELGDSFSSVYEDRLLAESYIYKLSDHLYQKKILMDQCRADENLIEVRDKISVHNTAIQVLIQDYEKTRLTEKESGFFQSLKKSIDEMNVLEHEYFKHSGEPLAQIIFDKRFERTSANLHELSSIQISEGKSLADHSKKIVAGSSILSHVEVAMIIVMGLILQIMIVTAQPVMPTTASHHRLN